MSEWMQQFRLLREKVVLGAMIPWLYFMIRFLSGRFGTFMCSDFIQKGFLIVWGIILLPFVITLIVDSQRVCWPRLLKGKLLADMEEWEPYFPPIRAGKYFLIGLGIVASIEIVHWIGCWLTS